MRLSDHCIKALHFLFLHDTGPRLCTGRTPGQNRVYLSTVTRSGGAERTGSLTDAIRTPGYA
jgi:hypothetical protein